MWKYNKLTPKWLNVFPGPNQHITMKPGGWRRCKLKEQHDHDSIQQQTPLVIPVEVSMKFCRQTLHQNKLCKEKIPWCRLTAQRGAVFLMSFPDID